MSPADKSPGHIIFSHGKESGPNATKITRLDAIASARGYSTQRPDYGTEASPEERTAKLSALIQALGGGRIILVGSSLGAYISGLCSVHAHVDGLFLLAPPVFFRGLHAPLQLRCKHTTLVHGWNDELIDPGEVVALARAHQAKLVLLPDDHRLSASMPSIEVEFAHFLNHFEAST